MMTAMSSERIRTRRLEWKGPATFAGPHCRIRKEQRSDRERRSAAAAAGGVRILEGEPGLLEVALVVDHGAVEILRAELIDKQPHTRALDDDVIRRRLRFDVQAITEARAPARQHRNAQSRRFLSNLFFREKLFNLFTRALGERQGNRFLCRVHYYPPVWQQLRR